MTKTKKYLDSPRFPKVSEKGYERDFKILYNFALQSLVVGLSKKMSQFTQ